jgi:hypothetical protein
MNEIEKVVDDPCNGDIVNVELVALDEKKQEVERTFELG